VRPLVVTVLIDLPPDKRYHVATLAALKHAADRQPGPVEVQVALTDTIGDVNLVCAPGSAVVVGPGSPYRDPDAVHEVIRTARERGVPLVGT
jgi:CTP synthase (UTP-ammonia lyase)